jgi:hypothetical protein
MIKAKWQAEAIREAMYKAPYCDEAKELNMYVISETADDPQPAVAAEPQLHTDLTVKDDAPITGQTGRGLEPLTVNEEPEPPIHRVGPVGSEGQDF